MVLTSCTSTVLTGLLVSALIAALERRPRSRETSFAADMCVCYQVDTFLAGFLLFSLTGQKETDEIQAEERVQVGS